MTTLVEHIRASAPDALPGFQDLDNYVGCFIKPPQDHAQWTVLHISSPRAAERELAWAALVRMLEEDGFKITRNDAARFSVTAHRTEPCIRDRDFTMLARRPAEFELRFEIVGDLHPDGGLRIRLSAPLASWSDGLDVRIRQFIDRTPEPMRSAAQDIGDQLRARSTEGRQVPMRGRVLGPGEQQHQGMATGDLRDYSACATETELADLQRMAPRAGARVLPLGHYHRFEPDSGTGPLLYLPGTAVPQERDSKHPVPHELPQAYQGALVVAPQDSGKTKLVVRWAKAANRAGYSLFLVDVKGNLDQKLREAGLQGEFLHFSTQPGVPTDRINFLAGMGRVDDPALAWQVRQLAHAILPSEGLEQGEQQYFLQNRLIWLRALIHLLKLKEAYLPNRYVHPVTGHRRAADLADLYEFIADPAGLYADLAQLLKLESSGRGRYRRGEVFGGAQAWIARAALLFAKDEVPGGQRSANHTYQEYVQGLLTPLESFARGGVLCDKVRDYGSADGGSLFSLDRLGEAEQVTVLLTAREQELDDAVTVTSMAVKRLQQLLFDRMADRQVRPILLLLDETRRIRSFKPGEYITFAREASAGCVIVYQSLDQIREEREITEILENVGTQIYLSGAVGKTAQRLIEFLPRRWRTAYSRTLTMGLDGSSSSGTLNEHQELVDFFQTGDLFRLPPHRGALVYLKNHSSGRPFIVDLDEDTHPELR